jgi:hypothetical protein
MSLKTGEWKMNENGVEGKLQINDVNPESGEVSGSIAGVAVSGLWDETSRTISFASHSLGVAELQRFYKGFLFSTPRNPVPGQDVVWTLAGFVQVVDLNFAKEMGGNARRNVFGWFAQISEVG